MHSRILLVVTMLAAGTAAAFGAQKKVIAPEGMDVGLPFSPAVQSGDFLYLAGAIGNEKGTLDVPEGIEAQVKKAMDNLGEVLKAGGMDFSRVVSANVFLSDARHFSAMNEIYKTYFPTDPPIRATVEADIAIPGALVEISMIAARPGVEKKVIKPSAMKSPELPYSWGIQVGSTLFVAGATARNPDTYQPVGGDMKVQTRRVLDNVGLVLKQAGMTHADVARCNVFMEDARYFGDMNEVYRSYFPNAPPARATVRARLMNPAFLSEIQCTAVKDPERKVVSDGPANPNSVLSPAIAAGGRLFLSGMVGRGPDGYPKGDVKAQTRLAFDRLRATLAADGLTFDDVLDVLVYVSDIRFYNDMNEVYREVMPSPPPARATVGVQLVSPDALVEIMMLAERK